MEWQVESGAGLALAASIQGHCAALRVDDGRATASPFRPRRRLQVKAVKVVVPCKRVAQIEAVP